MDGFAVSFKAERLLYVNLQISYHNYTVFCAIDYQRILVYACTLTYDMHHK